MTCDEWSFTITFSLEEYKAEVIAEIETAGQGIQNENINNWINAAINDINKQGTDTKAKVDNIKLKILDLIYAFQEGKADALGTLGTEQAGPAVVVIDQNDKTIRLYNPKKVKLIKVETEE